MKLKAIRNFFLSGKSVAAGSVFETDPGTGAMLVRLGRAVPSTDTEPHTEHTEPAPRRRARK